MSEPRFQLVPGSRLGGAGVGWRLLGANNRELGRSVPHLDGAEDALASIARARRLAVTAPAHVVHGPSDGKWRWTLLDSDGTPAVASGRGFRHERGCRYNLEQFRQAAPTAPAGAAADPAPTGGRRRARRTDRPSP